MATDSLVVFPLTSEGIVANEKKSLFAYSERYAGLSVDELFDKQKLQRTKIKKERKKHTFEKEGLSSRESRISVECPYCHCMEYSRYGKTRQGIQRYRCKKCGRIYVVSDGKNLHSSKLTASELLDLAKCIYLNFSVRAVCVMTGLSPKTVILWQKRAFSIATAWIDKAQFRGKTWIDEVYFHFANGKGTLKEADESKKAELSFSNVCVCIGYDEHGTMFCRVMKTGKVDELSILCCFSGRMDDVTLLVHDADKSHKVLIWKEKLEDKVVKSIPKTKESLKLMKPINDYSALLVNEMRKHPGTKASSLDDRLCFISYKSWLNSRYGEELGIRILLSEMVKAEKTVHFPKKRKK